MRTGSYLHVVCRAPKISNKIVCLIVSLRRECEGLWLGACWSLWPNSNRHKPAIDTNQPGCIIHLSDSKGSYTMRRLHRLYRPNPTVAFHDVDTSVECSVSYSYFHTGPDGIRRRAFGT